MWLDRFVRLVGEVGWFHFGVLEVLRGREKTEAGFGEKFVRRRTSANSA